MTADDRSPVTVLGLGPMGQALAGAFLRNGHPTTVWNRTATKAEPLVAQGATRADTVADAVAASPLVITCVIDYDAVHAITEPVAGALKGRTLVNLTADTPERARRTAAWAAGHGIDYLDGAIMTPTPTIGGPAAVVLYSGPEGTYQAHRPALASLGGTAAHLGADPGRAAAHDVALLDLFWTSMSGVAHAFALASAENIAATDLAPFAKGIGALLPGIIDAFAQNIDDKDHPGDASTILSAVAGMEHIIHASQAAGIDTGVLSAATAVARRAIDAGHGTDGFSRLTEVLRTPAPAA
ncbi:3-hydroxyisobutyrate dehydrogenase-like beta-hydroxyacid dehydrogenase [Streptosporangium album]|uniref:3-hydroxyisobutyrate dehydrogenase-like beta-hydroxyacid dehydrogenase n=1 Tax=Streptosporangium album TaxID=47479 RepID=A0A7W7RVR4_9ACTN|nr:NAD(P)-binding domain-containing protein [Streptosporangium album]MBB4939032.1 3-hydroxyisobutyrate dehydrogenase-like beta-hydroxyacid dehydrogenase [Streptosporangium album]